MATYAAYRHIELDNVGYGKKRVLKPPGGASSDIFGVSGAEQTTRPWKVKNHQMSNVLMNDEVDKAPATPTTPGKNSHLRLFGPPSPPKQTPKKNGAKSSVGNIITTDQNNGHHLESQNGDVHDSPKEELQNGNKSPQMNGNGNGHGLGNGSASTNGHSNGGTAPRARVPPGGYSSGLW
ncbi:microtubule-associated protein Jupiter isoform X2 [Cimex lectularius]|uniref:Microtubule-associated protein Jupiter n=1 Tax=Cimex lectularius TaxID=79782 RepID=A0A8I6RY98_CIMLE|nr:microtubule-associated protein Jupiter isoform X2 [Cimex lectularius]